MSHAGHAVQAAGVLILAALTTGCLGVPVRTDHDPDVDFGALESFAWLDPPLREEPAVAGQESFDPIVYNSLLDQRVRDAVEQALTDRGFRKDDGEPDFVIRYRVVSRPVTRSYPVFVGGAGYHHRGVHSHAGVQRTENYLSGTLILDVIDPLTERITWRGWAEARTRDGHLDAARVSRYVTGILARFPPPVSEEADAG